MKAWADLYPEYVAGAYFLLLVGSAAFAEYSAWVYAGFVPVVVAAPLFAFVIFEAFRSGSRFVRSTLGKLRTPRL